MEYTIDFRNSTNDTIDIETNISGRSYCTSDYDNATSVIIWATYEGTQGSKSEAKFLTTPEPSTPTTTTSPTKTQKGINLFMYLIMYVGR